MNNRFSVAMAVASHLGHDIEYLKTHRYQSTRTPCIVFSVDNEYYTATQAGRPRESNDAFMGKWQWKRVPSHGYCRHMAWRIWKGKPMNDYQYNIAVAVGQMFEDLHQKFDISEKDVKPDRSSWDKARETLTLLVHRAWKRNHQ